MVLTKKKSRKAATPAMEVATPNEPRKHPTWMPGDVAHQGDLIFVCLSAMPNSAKLRSNRQLAEGDTKGSRHVLVGGQIFDADLADVARLVSKATGRPLIDVRYMGPVFAGECVIEHPQHQHQAFPTHTATAVVFQRNLTADEREERARD